MLKPPPGLKALLNDASASKLNLASTRALCQSKLGYKTIAWISKILHIQ
jgi:hypothetical protein